MRAVYLDVSKEEVDKLLEAADKISTSLGLILRAMFDDLPKAEDDRSSPA